MTVDEMRARIREIDAIQARNEAISARIREIRDHPETASRAELDTLEAEVNALLEAAAHLV